MSNGSSTSSGLPGWLGTARRERFVEEPGRPAGVEALIATNVWREYITASAAPAGSRRGLTRSEAARTAYPGIRSPVRRCPWSVAEKRVTIVERRGLTESMWL